MGEINFNVTDNSYPYDCLYYDTNYGYRACLNGKRLDIADIKTVIALKNQFGLPELNISVFNLNISDYIYSYDCFYYDRYGYRSCLNGRRFDIAKIETVLALRDNFGLPDLNIKADDLERFEKCIY